MASLNRDEVDSRSRNVRRILLALVVLGSVGLVAELLLLEHIDSWTQWLPLGALGAAIASAALLWWRPARWSVLLFRALMLACIATGLVGIWLHFAGNRAFELEMDSTLEGWLLAWHSLRGATPALAPGAMVQLGLLGLVLTWRHPALHERDSDPMEIDG